MTAELIALAVGAYLLGGIPFGVVVGRRWKGVDVRQFGSGNIGFANVLRTLGWEPALVVFICDVGKGYLPVLAATRLAAGSPHPELWVLLVGVMAVLGHVFSPFLRFRGGRAVLTSLGVLVGIAPWVALVGLVIGAAMIAATRYVSVGSLLGVTAACAMAWLSWPEPVSRVYAGFVTVAAAIIIIRHLPNIKRLLAGRELKVGARPTGAADSSGGGGGRG
jgi:glycerol-3-phosphate acyltransferase PlsY